MKSLLSGFRMVPSASRLHGSPRHRRLGCGRTLSIWCGLSLLAGGLDVEAGVIFETTTPYHHIRVVDANGQRTLEFDGASQSRMSLSHPLRGHFEYTEMFHLAWLWNDGITNVLMVGLGGASTQRAFEHDYPGVRLVTVEIDPAVRRVAKEYFQLRESPRQRVFVEDGRVFLRRTRRQFDAIFMDAYSENRYGAFIPQHLATKEFFVLAASHLTTNGVLAYNVMGNLHGWQVELLGAIYKTLRTAFPQVYLFPCRSSQNVVFLATKSSARAEANGLARRADRLVREHRVSLPTFRIRLGSFRAGPPQTATRAPVLTDDFAPMERLLNGVGRQTER